MNFNLIKTIISISISGLIAYGLYSFHSEKNREVLAIGSFISFAITLLFSLAITFKFPRTTTLIRTVSFIFFFLALVSNLIFYFTSFNQDAYIIINGILLLIYALIIYTVQKAKQ